ncbi:MAG: pirin family protein [Verrucomicrobiota bacterium]
MKTKRNANERGVTQFERLDSRHSFSFGGYYDPDHVKFGHLRVMNDDRIGPGGTFPPHPHTDMEIFSYVPEGLIEHKDNLGNSSHVGKNRVQLMTAGRGIVHSEGNPSDTDPTHLYQIWITPEKRGLTPDYQELDIDESARENTWALLASPDGRNGSMTIRQQAEIRNAHLVSGKSLDLPVGTSQKGWLQVVSGSVASDNHVLKTGDGLAIENENSSQIQALEDADLLFFTME